MSMSTIQIKNWFDLDSETQRQIRLKTEVQSCPDCRGTGGCKHCRGTGEHECDCKFCRLTECEECDDTGKCAACGGKGERLLAPHELKQAGVMV